MQKWLNKYFNTFKRGSVTTEQMKEHFLNYFSNEENKVSPDVLKKIDWDHWLTAPGLPSFDVSNLFNDNLQYRVNVSSTSRVLSSTSLWLKTVSPLPKSGAKRTVTALLPRIWRSFKPNKQCTFWTLWSPQVRYQRLSTLCFVLILSQLCLWNTIFCASSIICMDSRHQITLRSCSVGSWCASSPMTSPSSLWSPTSCLSMDEGSTCVQCIA